MCEGHKCTLGKRIKKKKVTIEIIQTVDLRKSDRAILDVYLLCVSHPGSLDMSGTLNDTAHSEDQ